MERSKYREIILDHFKNGKNLIEINKYMEEVYGSEKPSLRTIQRWYANFATGHTSTLDEARSGHPISAISPALISSVEKIIKENRKISIRSLASATNSFPTTIFRVLHDYLNKEKLYARWVPKELTPAQKSERVRVAREILEVWSENWDELMSRIITCDETWVHYVTPETAESSREWRGKGEGRPLRGRLQTRKKKIMATVFWDCKDIIFIDYFKQNPKKGMDSVYYGNLIEQLRKMIQKKDMGFYLRCQLFYKIMRQFT